jgi:hypothetical protein
MDVVLVIPDLRNRVAPEHAAVMWLLSARGDSGMVGYVPDQLAQHRILPMVTSSGVLWTKTAIIYKVRPSGRGSLRRVKEVLAGMLKSRTKAMVLVGAPLLLPPPIPRWAREGKVFIRCPLFH